MIFQRCHTCGLEVELKATTVGTMLVVDGVTVCHDGHMLHWQSQPSEFLFCGLTSLLLLI